MVSWVARKSINHERVKELLKKSIEKNHFTNGSPLVEMLENRIRETLKIEDSKAIICVSNGTAAIWAAVAAIELYHSKDMTFYTQSFTFPASAQGYLDNARIVDIDHDGGIDLDLIDLNTCDGIIVTNVFGNVVDISKYESWCKTHNKFLIFDNAATSNTFYKGRNSCNYGTASTLSFHHTKPIGFGEGGCVIIDKKFERTFRNIINFGIDNTSPIGKWHRKGGNYKMSDLQAVYIIQYLDNFDVIVNKKNDVYGYFVNRISERQDIKFFPNFSDGIPFVSCISILMDNSAEVMQKLLDNDIYCRKYYTPLIPGPVATAMYNQIICISCTDDMTRDDVDRIVSIIQLNCN
uniref:DegT/DnrJ/EryC1/StrS aminotransferase family protein n=1 Tax=viral metagenome TaxID=1070528 RepID=A0A6C0JLL1_9ZZZZ